MPFEVGLPNVSHNMRRNWKTLKDRPLAELSGSLGDMGTLLPLLILMTNIGCIRLPSTLVFGGIWNILSGAIFGIPMVVQPMKAIAAVAIDTEMSIEETMSAGLGVSAIVLALAITGLLGWLNRAIYSPIVKGIQMGAGLTLIITAGKIVSKLQLKDPWWDNQLWAVAGVIIMFGTFSFEQFPFALIMFVVGIVFALVHGGGGSLGFAFQNPFEDPIKPSLEEFKSGFLNAGLGQLPLTTLNSIIAVNSLSIDLFSTAHAAEPRDVGISVALMNLVGCWFGASPVCHGSGGLAGQYRFGARSGASVMILGIVKILCGLFFGAGSITLLERFPKSFLAVMVFSAGLQLTLQGANLEGSESEDLSGLDLDSLPGQDRTAFHRDRFLIMMATAGTMLAFHNSFAGLCAGLVCNALIWVQSNRRVRIQIDGTQDEVMPVDGSRDERTPLVDDC